MDVTSAFPLGQILIGASATGIAMYLGVTLLQLFEDARSHARYRQSLAARRTKAVVTEPAAVAPHQAAAAPRRAPASRELPLAA